MRAVFPIVIALVSAGTRVGLATMSLPPTHSAAVCLERRVAHTRQPLEEVLGVPKGSTQLFFSDGHRLQVTAPIGLQIEWAALCPGDSLVAFSGYSGEPHPSKEVVITTLNGVERARFHGAWAFTWSPVAPLLAIDKARLRGEEEVPDMFGIDVWDARTGKVSTSPAPTYQTGWIDADTLVLFDASTFRDLDWRSGQVTSSRHRGTIVSPDRRFSLWLSYEGSEELWDLVENRDIAESVLRVVGVTRFAGDMRMPPFWLASEGHDLCIPISGLPRKPEDPDSTSGARVAVVDVERLELKTTIPGKLIAPTTDYEGALVSVGKGVRIVEIKP